MKGPIVSFLFGKYQITLGSSPQGPPSRCTWVVRLLFSRDLPFTLWTQDKTRNGVDNSPDW